MRTQLQHHLADARNVVVAAADEGDERLPGVLVEDADAREGGRATGEVGIGEGPLGVEGGERGGEGKVTVQEGRDVVVGFGVFMFGGSCCPCCRPCHFVVKMGGFLA